jgi:predicted ester cyclase
MSTEQNKATVRRWYLEIFNQNRLDVADGIHTLTYINHDPYAPPGGFGVGPQATRNVVTLYRAAFPDVQFIIDAQVAEGDKVATRWTATGTNTGSLNGMPPTNRRITISGISIERFEGGKIAESWVNWDFLGMLQQLGVIPAAG